MKFFEKYRMTHGGLLYDNAGDETNMPEQDKLEASRKMIRDKGVGRIFAQHTRPEEQVLEQLTKQQNGKKINN
jgi:hypothetical protein